MFKLSPAWQQGPRETARKQSINTMPPSSSDSDSGCPQEEGPGIASDFTATQVVSKSPPLKEAKAPLSARCPRRIRTLLCQLPPHDSDVRYCSALAKEEWAPLQQFCIQRRLQSLGRGTVQPLTSLHTGNLCERCGRKIPRGALAVLASGIGGLPSWHTSCFVCCTCEEPLFDLIYFHHRGRIYCGRHHAELFRPRCASCDQLIFTEELTEAEGWYWHLSHFCCSDCGTALGGQRYVMKGGRPYCCSCFESSHADTCHTCGDTIGLDSERVTHQGQHWHARTCCFRCQRCQKPLMGHDFIPHSGFLWCSMTCCAEPSSSSSSGSDSACLSAPSPIARRPLRGADGSLPSMVKRQVCNSDNQKPRAANNNIKMARNSSMPLVETLGTNSRRGNAQGSSQVPSAHDRHMPEGGGSSRKQDTHWSEPSLGNVRNGDGEVPNVCQAHEHGRSGRMLETCTQNQDPVAGKAFTATSLGHQDISLEHTSANDERPLIPNPQEPVLAKAVNECKMLPPITPQHHSAEQHRGLGSVYWTEQLYSYTTLSQICRPGAHPKDGQGASENMAAQKKSVPKKDDSRESDSWCPTCSSSSDSEQEGYFLGRPIPSFRVGDEPDCEKDGQLNKAAPRSKHCALS